MILLCTVLVLLPSMSIYFAMYYSMSRVFTAEVERRIRNELDITVHDFANAMSELQYRIEALLTDTYMDRNLFFPRTNMLEETHGPYSDDELQLLPDYVEAKHYIVNSLLDLERGFDFIQSIYLYNEGYSDLVYDTGRVVRRFEDFYDTDWHTAIADNVSTQRIMEYREYADPFGVRREAITVVYRRNGIWLVINISPQALLDVNLQNSRMQCRRFLLKRSLGKVISADMYRQDAVGSVLADYILGSQMSDGQYEVINVAEGNQLAVYADAPYTGWMFVHVVPMADLDESLRLMRRTATLAIPLSLLLVILLVPLFTKSMYSPIKTLVRIARSGQHADGTFPRFSDIAVVANRMGALRAENRTLVQRLEVALPASKERFLSHLLRFDVEDMERTREQYHFYGCSFPEYEYRVVIFQLLDDRVGDSSEHDIYIYRLFLRECADRLLGEERRGFAVEGPDDQVLIAFHMPQQCDEELSEFIHSLVSEIRKEIDNRFFIAVGETAPHIYSLEISYRSAMQALDYKKIRDSGSIVYFDRIPHGSGTQAEKLSDYEQKLTKAFYDGDVPEIRRILDSVFGTIVAYQDDLSVEDVSIFYERMLSVICDAAEKRSTSAVKDFRPLRYADILQRGHREEIRVFLRNLAEHAMALGTDRQLDQIPVAVRAAREYVEENFNDPRLCLQSVADHVNLNPAYLSRLFKETLGSKFTNYVTALRMQQAMELLKTTAFRIYEIASLAGYPNGTYFTSVFKKHIGMTPEEYRNSTYTA